MPMQKEHTPSQPAMLPKQFSEEYTEYYQFNDSDSPERARQEMIGRLLERMYKKLQTQETINILDVGAGKQKLELELQQNPDFQEVQERVNLVTLDIASFRSQNQLLAKNIPHIEANATHLPFSSGSFDVVFSCLAIDFMPREETFGEVGRILKPDGELLINFHHPNLGNNADQLEQAAIKKRRHINQKLQFARKSKKYPQYEKMMQEVQVELRDIQFVKHIFPKLIFHCPHEIQAFLSQTYPGAEVDVREIAENGSQNGWYEATILYNLAS